MRKIDVSVDTFALIWAARRMGEDTEDEIIARLARETAQTDDMLVHEHRQLQEAVPAEECQMADRPRSREWIDVLVWSLKQLGGQGSLADIYRKSKEARRLLGLPITKNHDASARERLESYCAESRNYKGIADLFYMPEGKGAGIWALN